MDDKKRERTLVILFIFILIITGILFILIYNGGSKDSKTTKKASSASIEQLKPKRVADNVNISSEMQNTVINKIKDNYLFGLKYSDNSLEFSNTDLNNSMLDILYAYIVDNGDLSGDNLNQYFSNLYNFVPNNYLTYKCPTDNIDLLVYDARENKYYINANHPGHGYALYDYIDYRVVGYTEENDTLNVSILFLSGNNAEGYYINDTEIDESAISNFDNDDIEKAYKQYFYSLKDNQSLYKPYIFTFTKVNEDIYLRAFSK